ncbi:putative disease resistance protein At3g14460 [Corylus avellana]|uniref:putative disease resistance protein At3g14460 n=1 Tax=Corylus avellana TaxID=13451 RepID=UPI00286C3FF2|nr:putative disease resistance protein At3g14460 [Corylus avellana]
MEEVGVDYFLDLASRSLLEQSSGSKSGCKDLTLLPRDMWKLINLRHLDISKIAIKEMPMQLKLQNVVSPTNALKACLSDREYLEELVLDWNALDTNISECQRSLLDNLRPHSNLRSLAIHNYGAKSLPDWVGHYSYSNIVSLQLKNCKLCPNLPPLGELPSLQHLSIVGFEGVVKVDRGLPVDLPSAVELEILECPQLEASLPKAPFVRKLQLRDCNEVLLKELPTKLEELKIGGFGALESFPMGMVAPINCLHVLEIEKCMKLELPTHLDFSSLERLLLDDCDSLKSFPLDLFPKLKSIDIWGCKNLISFTDSEQHGRDLAILHIAIGYCPNFVSFPKGGIRAPKLSFFYVANCESLRSLPSKMHILLPSLNVFQIFDCPRVQSFPEGGLTSNVVNMGWGLQKLPSLKDLRIGGKYEDVVSFPEPGLLPSGLTYLCIDEFPNMKSWDNKGLQHLTSLQHLRVMNCPKLNCMPEEGLLTSLSVIEIKVCPLLRKQWQSKKGKERRKIPNVDHILIDDEEYIG